MKLSLFLTPLSDHHLRLAAQIGVSDIVAPYPGLDLDNLRRTRDRVAEHGLHLTVIERHLPHDKMVHGRAGHEEQRADVKTLIANMAKCGVSTLCYNWMPDDDWQRTSITVHDRGRALVTAFDIDQVTPPSPPSRSSSTPGPEMWKHLERFLQDVAPFAEDHGVTLALHPDDPPLDRLRGQDRIVTSYDAFERVLNLHSSPSNQLCFCQGTFAARGESIPAGIERFASHIAFVHFRDVRGQADRFQETFHDNGQTDMAACMRAYRAIGFTGPLRPDHVPTLDGETNKNPGYEMLGRLHAIGYIKGLLDATHT